VSNYELAKIEVDIAYCNLMVESVVADESLKVLAMEILAQKGPLPVGEIGKILAELTSIPSLSLKLKEKFGGLKKFLEQFPACFVVSNDHPFNPNVLLRSSLSTEHLELIDKGIFPHQLLIKAKKAAAASAKKKKASSLPNFTSAPNNMTVSPGLVDREMPMPMNFQQHNMYNGNGNLNGGNMGAYRGLQHSHPYVTMSMTNKGANQQHPMTYSKQGHPLSTGTVSRGMIGNGLNNGMMLNSMSSSSKSTASFPNGGSSKFLGGGSAYSTTTSPESHSMGMGGNMNFNHGYLDELQANSSNSTMRSNTRKSLSTFHANTTSNNNSGATYFDDFLSSSLASSNNYHESSNHASQIGNMLGEGSTFGSSSQFMSSFRSDSQGFMDNYSHANNLAPRGSFGNGTSSNNSASHTKSAMQSTSSGTFDTNSLMSSLGGSSFVGNSDPHQSLSTVGNLFPLVLSPEELNALNNSGQSSLNSHSSNQKSSPNHGPIHDDYSTFPPGMFYNLNN
jgi:hypothetical protein